MLYLLPCLFVNHHVRILTNGGVLCKKLLVRSDSEGLASPSESPLALRGWKNKGLGFDTNNTDFSNRPFLGAYLSMK